MLFSLCIILCSLSYLASSHPNKDLQLRQGSSTSSSPQPSLSSSVIAVNVNLCQDVVPSNNCVNFPIPAGTPSGINWAIDIQINPATVFNAQTPDLQGISSIEVLTNNVMCVLGSEVYATIPYVVCAGVTATIYSGQGQVNLAAGLDNNLACMACWINN